MTRRLLFELSVLSIALFVGVAWAAFRLSAAKNDMRSAEDDIRICRKLATQITELRERPSVAGTRERQTSETATEIERAAAVAKIEVAQSLVSISPELPRRVGDTAYKEAPTQIVLTGITLRQLVAFLSALAMADNGLQARSLRLTAPRDDLGDRWTVDVTVSYLIYAPRTADSALERGG